MRRGSTANKSNAAFNTATSLAWMLRSIRSRGLLSLGKDIPHEVEALEESAVLVTIAEPKL